MTVAKKKAKGSRVEDLYSDSLMSYEDFGTWPSWSTGITFLDVITGVGGLPKGRIVECYGAPSSGKTTMLLMAAAEAQKEGERIVFLDFERAFDPQWATFLGIDVNGKNEGGEKTFLLFQPKTLEEGFEIASIIVEQAEHAIVIMDSLAAMVPEKMLDPDFNMERAGLYRAQKFHQQFRLLNSKLESGSKTCIGVINQEYENVNFTGTGGQITPGGKALKFYASMRIEFKKIGQVSEEVVDSLTLEKEKRVVEHKIRATVTKNKVGSPFKRTLFVCREGVGIDVVASVFDLAAKRGIIESPAKSRFVIPADLTGAGDMKFHGKKAVVNFLREDFKVFGAIEEKVLAIIENANTAGEEYTEVEDSDLEDGQGALQFIGEVE